MEFGETAVESRPCLETVRALHQTVVALRSALEQSRSEILELKQRVWPIKSVENALRNFSEKNNNSATPQIDTKTCESQTREIKQTEDVQENKTRSLISQQKQVRISTSSPRVEIVEESPLPSDSEGDNSEGNLKKPQSEPNLIEISIAIENLSSRRFSKSLENLTLVKNQSKSAGSKHLGLSKTLSFSNIPNLTSSESCLITMTDNYGKKSFESISPRKDTSSNRTVSSPRHISTVHSALPTSTISSSMYVSSSPNISFSETPQDVCGNKVLTKCSTLENAQSEPVLQNTCQSDSEQNDEVDDIELIFTTEETKDSDFKEELVPIETSYISLHSDSNNKNLQCPNSDLDQSFSDRELEDDVFRENDSQDNSNIQSHSYNRENSQLFNSKSDNSINHEDKSLKSYYSYQDSSFENKSLEKDESFDRFEEKIRIIETDISKCGIVDVEYGTGRRNTCPNPLPYRPIIHREAMGKCLNIRKGRPILSHSSNARRESGAQTDISALPSSSWRSESSLAHKVKVGDHFPTLPSKFPLPGSRLRLSEKTNVEARRILLSDIGFTSMVPELSRSADHLCPKNMKIPVPTSYGQFLRTSDLYSPGFASQKFSWTATTISPSETSQFQSRFGSMYPLLSPPPPSRRFSAPVSPSARRVLIKPTISKVRFANGSLPELRGEWGTTADSGDSTDSLVEEAENYLRRSIDCINSSGDSRYNSSKVRCSRRASAPEPSGDNVPPQDWQPFLPRTPRDLHLDHWVKVIVPEGRVKGGRVRYIGPILNQVEPFVGVQLGTPDGYSDGTHNNRRYFNCEPYHGIFVPFKKVVMGWRP